MPANRLANETSPYLQQHADNPVDWYPWGEEALDRARREAKPILLSIGYSACHWCHVMAHESFEDPAVAAMMNEHFVNVKVDREERPDVDQIYQTAHQMLTRRAGGWPLTMFLAPDQVPFFGGTYFPKTPRYNLPGFVEIMQRVVEAWRTRHDSIAEQNRAVLAAFGRGDQASAATERAAFDRTPIVDAIAHLAGRFDAVHGGFGAAPKFPHPTDLELCMRQWARAGDPHALEMALVTLEKMAAGGVFDHLGGGFARYSVDAQWMIPHFEKMLYDNGPLLALYTDAWRITKREVYARVVAETAGWIMREMQSPDGGYYSSLDADSEGEEGRFYRWDRAEVESLLDADEYRLVAQYYGFAGHANFEGHYWHLSVIQPLAEAADRAAIARDAAAGVLASARAKLYAARERRVRPGRDEKVLASWNALAIGGMARAALAFDRADWLDSAERAMRFVREVLWRDGRLLATWKDGYAHLNAYLDDYAYLLDAAIASLEARFDPALLDFASALGNALIALFEDSQGGFFFTSHDHERLIHRPKQGYDGATPAGNAVAARALTRLGHVLGEPRFLVAAERAIGAFYASIAAHPEAYGSFLIALDEVIDPPRMAVIRGPAAAATAWARRLARDYRPDLIILAIGREAAGPLPPALAAPAPAVGVNAHVCQSVSCSSPIDSLAALEATLGAGGIPRTPAAPAPGG